MSVVSVKDLRKTYNGGKTMALKGVDLQVREGELFGLIGPDGAGKTTLFRILATLLLADSGTVSVGGLDVRRDYRLLRRQIGYMPGRFSLYQDLTVEENLRFFASIFHTTVEANYHLVADIYKQIEPFKHRKAGKLSGGMKQKLALSCALIHAPRLLLLDEPTTGVDPVSRREFWEMLKKLQNDYPITIIVSTPYMDEASMCDRIALMQEGDFLETASPGDIIRQYRHTLWSVRTDHMHRLLHDLRAWQYTHTAFSFGETFHLTVKGMEEESADEDVRAPKAMHELQQYLAERDHGDIRIQAIAPDIEDCFMALADNS